MIDELMQLAQLRARDGRHTAELVREPGRFGLGQVPTALAPDATTSVVCGFCSTGCSLDVHLKDGQAVNLSADADYPVNMGMACPKGWESLAPLSSTDRALKPMLRNDAGVMKEVEWEHAMTVFCRKIAEIQAELGPDSVAYLSTGQICTEEMAFLGALAKFGLGIIHGDGNTRQCMATAAVAYKQSFGFDAPPYAYADFEESDVIVLVGSNLCITHPIMWQRVLRNPHGPEIVVLDPRKTETAMCATQHYALAPRSDLIFLYGIAHVLVREGWLDRNFLDAHTNDFDAFAAHVRQFPPESITESCGIPVAEIEKLARTIHEGKRVSFWWTMGVNQGYEAVRTAQAIINLALMTGNIGRPGTGANSITGQCNAMGSRLFSNTTNLLGGHDFNNAGDREKIARVLGIDVGMIPERDSWAYDQIMDGIAEGKIKALWVIATNTSHSWIHQRHYIEMLSKLDFLVVQDMYATTETAQLAHLVLPAAGWGEKDGTFINSERRFGLVKKVSRAPGQALSDFNIFKLIAHYAGKAPMFSKWSSPEAVLGILGEISKGQPCDISGIRSYRMLDEEGGIQWPHPEGETLESRERRLFADGRFFHPDGRARFLFDMPARNPEPVDAVYPLLLLTGRGTSAQWHTQTRTSKSPVLRKLYPAEIYVELNPADALALDIEANEPIIIESRRGRIQARAVITPTVKAGQIFIPMHYKETNRLTHPSFDPHSRQPNYKACAVRLERVTSAP